MGQALGLHAAFGAAALAVAVGERQAQLVTAGRRQCGQQRGIHHRPDTVHGQDGGAQCIHLLPQAGGHGLLQLDQGPKCGLFNAADRAGRGSAQGNRHGQRFVVVQQQGRQRLTGPEGIAARHAAAGMHGVAQLAQAVDVAPQGARVHFQALGQFRPHPVVARLQQGEQTQQAG